MPVKVSVIVPVYNVEQYLEKCLNSLVSQTLEDIEIIVVNDGSPDGCQDIIDIFASTHPGKVVALRQENRGSGPARNFGMQHAKGEYIGFADSDDWAAPNMFQLMYETAKMQDADAVICDFYKVEDVNRAEDAEVTHVSSSEISTIADYVRNSTMYPAPWNKLVKRELALKIPYLDFHIPEDDLATTPSILSYCSAISYLPEPLYFYMAIRPGSLMAQVFSQKEPSVVKAWERCLTACNSAYIEEMAYAVYFHVYKAVATRREHLDSFYIFLWKYEEYFTANKYIQDEIASDAMGNLFAFMDLADGADASTNPLASNLQEFLDDTTPLILRLGELPQETLSELREMYEMALQSIGENAAAAGPKLLVKLSSRYERIQGAVSQRLGAVNQHL